MPRAAWWGVCSALALLFLYPLYVMLSQSLKDPEEAAAEPPTLYPHALSTQNYSGLANGETGSTSSTTWSTARWSRSAPRSPRSC